MSAPNPQQKRKLESTSTQNNAPPTKRTKMDSISSHMVHLGEEDTHHVRPFNTRFGIASGKDTKLTFPVANQDADDAEQHWYTKEEYAAYVDEMGGFVYQKDPKDADYQYRRRCAHGYTWGKSPAIIACCVGVSDVIATVKFAAAHKMRLACRSGGHSSIGACTGSGNTIVLDLSLMKNMNFNADYTEVTVGPGITFGQIATEIEYLNKSKNLDLHIVTGGCDTVAMSGYAMGGGYGLTSRNFGMGCDQITEFEVVLADGSVQTVRKGDDLFWALQGGTGGNFGVVTSMKVKVHHGLNNVTYFSFNYPIEQLEKIFPLYQNKYCTDEKPKELSAYLMMFYFQRKEWEGLCVSVRGIYNGTIEETKKHVQDLADITCTTKNDGKEVQFPITEFKYGTYRLMNKGVEGDTYAGMGSGYPDGQWKECMIVEDELNTDQIKNIVDRVKNMPSFGEKVNLVYCEPYGGQINAVKPEDTAFVHRRSRFDFVIDSMYYTQDGDSKDKAYNWMTSFIDSFGKPRTQPQYQNYPTPRPDAKDYYAEAYWGSNYQRLREIKTKVDPTNFFTFSQQVHPLPKTVADERVSKEQ